MRWWTDNPMTYDWRGEVTAEPYSSGWFEAMDQRFLEASRPYLSSSRPFDVIMPDDLAGKEVLEIGCGMGLHTAQLVERGATVTAMDLTAPAVQATQARLALLGHTATVLQHDAENLPFNANTFDFVWSWGVIHHSGHTARIVREISRVLKGDGEARIMVYNRDGIIAHLIAIRFLLSGFSLRGKTLDETLWGYTDGYLARYYTLDQARDLFSAFFDDVQVKVLGQDVDVVPVPRRLRAMIVNRLSTDCRARVAARRGGFLFVSASRPY